MEDESAPPAEEQVSYPEQDYEEPVCYPGDEYGTPDQPPDQPQEVSPEVLQEEMRLQLQEMQAISQTLANMNQAQRDMLQHAGD